MVLLVRKHGADADDRDKYKHEYHNEGDLPSLQL